MPKCPECQTEVTAGARFCNSCGSPMSVTVSDNVLNRSALDASQTQARINVNIAPGVSPDRPLRLEELVHCKVCGLLLEVPKWRCPECESYVCEQHYLTNEFMCLRCHRQKQAPALVVAAMPPAAATPSGPELGPWERMGTRAGEEVTGPDGGVYVWVPAGEFMMGSNDGDDDEQPTHKVRLSRGFWLGKHTVTDAQYSDFCQAKGRVFPAESQWGEDHPVVCVTWDDAVAYCQHYGLALPTEAEWEYAARGIGGCQYPWGDGWDQQKCCSQANKGPGGTTYQVGNFPAGASWCGALDMAGNVWEWCQDLYAEDYYCQSPTEDPLGPSIGEYRVLRGGAWDNGINDCRCAYRGRFDPRDGTNTFGFRCMVRVSDRLSGGHQEAQAPVQGDSVPWSPRHI